MCRLSSALHEATRAFFAVLDRLTIADIAANRGALLDRLDGARGIAAAERGQTALQALTPNSA